MNRKDTGFPLEDAQRLTKESETLRLIARIETESFEKTIVNLMEIAHQMWEISNEHRSFRMELFYNAETSRVNYYFFVPSDKSGSDCSRQESVENQD